MDKKDFIAAFDQYSRQIYTFVFFRVNNSKESAQDLVQEVFLKAWEKRNAFDESQSSLKTWLFIIAKSQIIDHYRKAGAQKRDSIEVPVDEMIIDDSVNHEEKVLIGFLIQKLQFLSTYEQELITLRYFAQLDIAEISQILNKKYNTAKADLTRTLHKLKSLVNG
jgi:RNA polymerase sigma-70 factor, ECF subfamily